MIDNQLYTHKEGHTELALPSKNETATISWGAVFAGTLVSLSLSILFTFLIAGLGLGQVDMHAHNPFSGLGTVFNITSALTLALSLAAGSYIAGRLAGRSGMSHGFLNWALMTLLTTILSVLALGATAKLATSAVSSTISATGSAVGSAADMLTDSKTGMINFDQNNMLESTIDKAKQNISQALNNTDIKALHTDNLEAAFHSAKKDVNQAIEQFKSQPGQYQTILSNLLAKLQANAEGITDNINRDDVVHELMQRGWTQEDAEQGADKAIAAYQEAKNSVTTQLANAQDFVNNLPQNMQELKDSASDTINSAADTMQKATLWTFFGGLLGAIISAIAGMIGERSRHYHDYNHRMLSTTHA